MIIKCLECGRPLRINKGYQSKRHKHCLQRIIEERKAYTKDRTKRLRKMTDADKKVLNYIRDYLTKPTSNQIKDVCSYWGADYKKIKANMDLTKKISRRFDKIN